MTEDYRVPTQQTHFLVSGGGKGITAACVIALAEDFHCRFTLFGRSELLEEEPDWARGISSEADLKKSGLAYFQEKERKLTPRELQREVNRVLSSREISETLQKVESAGGQAEYLQADILSAEELKEVLGPISDRFQGILHGAGALADKKIQDKTEKDFDLVFGVKVQGLQNLLQIIPPDQLKFLILFSSIAGHYGNPGQADYSLSNEILNKYAHYLHQAQPGCRVLALDWGPWDGGMVSPQLKRILERRSIPLISLSDGPEVLVHLLRSEDTHPQWIVGDPLPFPPRPLPEKTGIHRLNRTLTLDANPFLADHVIGGKAVLPTVCAVGWMVNGCENLYPGYLFHSVSDYKVFNGIIFDDSLADTYQLQLTEIQLSSEALIFDALISSQLDNGPQRRHYQARIQLSKQLDDPPRWEDFNLQVENSLAGDHLYREKILFHGPSFQGVSQVINHSAEHLTTRCQLDRLPAAETGQFPIRTFNPFLADVHLQSLLIWSSLYQGVVGLPLQITSGIQYRPVPPGQPSLATMQVKKTTKHKLVADVISHDQQGLVFSEVRGAEITLSERLAGLFQESNLVRKGAAA